MTRYNDIIWTIVHKPSMLAVDSVADSGRRRKNR
jgi:hypothetical protein